MFRLQSLIYLHQLINGSKVILYVGILFFYGFLRKHWPERFPYFKIVELQALSFFASGTLFMAFFISLCSSLLLPFRCNVHPNGRWTVQTYHEAWDDKHSRAAGSSCDLLQPLRCSAMGPVSTSKWHSLVDCPVAWSP